MNTKRVSRTIARPSAVTRTRSVGIRGTTLARAMAVAIHLPRSLTRRTWSRTLTVERVEAEDRVVDEDLAVDLADVESAHAAAPQELHGRRQIDRDAEVAREMVESPEGQDAERHVPADQGRGDRPDRAVAAAGRDDLGAGGQSLVSRLHRLLAGNEAHIGLVAGLPEHRAQGLGIQTRTPHRSRLRD